MKQGQNYKLKIDASLHDVENIAIVDPIEINFTAGDVSRSETAVEEFETPDMITFDATQSIGTTTAKAIRSTAQKLFGSASYNFTYTFNADEGSCRIHDSRYIRKFHCGRQYPNYRYAHLRRSFLRRNMAATILWKRYTRDFIDECRFQRLAIPGNPFGPT